MAVELLGIPMFASTRIDVYSGVQRMSGRIWAALHHADKPSRTVVLLPHPSSNFMGHYLLGPLSERGVDAVGLTTRYLGNDSSLIMENCVLDIGAAVKFLRSRGYENVVLGGNSGGGGLSAFYQGQAESPTVTSTPAGDPPDLTTVDSADLSPADGLIELMAHPGRASVLAEFIDPAILDEHDPSHRDSSLDLYSGEHEPPFHPDFLVRYRAAQLERIRRITSWVKAKLVELDADTDGVSDLPFVVHGTLADPRLLDLSLDPSDREPGTLWGPAKKANLMPASLAHYSSLRSWLSQWSVDDSNADGLRSLRSTTVPSLFVSGTADQVCFPSFTTALYDAVPHPDKEMVVIKGGTHYLQGQPQLVNDLADRIVAWLGEHSML